MLVNVHVKVGEAHALEDECYLELLGYLESWIALLFGFCVLLPCMYRYPVKDKLLLCDALS